MDCTHCEPVLLDLCYGELAPAQEREVRAHVHECPACRKALSRIEAGQALARHLPDEAPSPEMTDNILRAAQAHLRKRGGPFERFQGFLESMARLAMTRQVAMATMSLVIVFVGLWSIPELTQRKESRATVVVEAPHDGEAGPSAARPTAAAVPEPAASEPVPPAEVAAQLDTRKRDLGQGNDMPPRARRRQVASVEAKGGGGLALREQASNANGLERAKQQPKDKAAEKRFAPPPPAAASRQLDDVDELLAQNLAKRESSATQGASSSGRVERKPRAAAEAEGDYLEGLSGGLEDYRRNPYASGSEPAKTAAPASPAPTAAAAPAGPSSLEEVYAAGVERYRAADYAAAAKLFSQMLESSSPSAQRPAALLYLARSERALGRCDRAIRAYETLVRSYGSAQQSALALAEGVGCFDKLGDAAGAQRLLEHATSVPSLSAQATKALHDRSAGKPAEVPTTAVEPSPR
jgi:TolA-binding protein/anti-sigma factor RsiW